jgi:ABC-type transport system involved in multi-copper enzyme maturation permease subunit
MALRLVARQVMIQIKRRRDLGVLAIIVGLYLVGMISVSQVGIENPATATFLLNLGLTLASLAAHIMTLGLAARQFPEEFENRTLLTFLARPLDRSTLVIGKWAACAACGCGVLVTVSLVAWLPAPKMESFDTVLLLQCLVLLGVSVSLLAALAICSSLVAPRSVAFVGTALLYLFGGKALSLVRNLTSERTGGEAIRWLTGYVPDFSKLNLLTRLTDGQVALSAPMFIGLVAYGALLIGLLLAVSTAVFQRRSL